MFFYLPLEVLSSCSFVNVTSPDLSGNQIPVVNFEVDCLKCAIPLVMCMHTVQMVTPLIGYQPDLNAADCLIWNFKLHVC